MTRTQPTDQNGPVPEQSSTTSKGQGRRPLGPLLATLAAFLFFNGANGLWLALDERPLVWDHHSHYMRAMKYGYFVRNGHRLNIPGKDPAAHRLREFQEARPAATYAATAPVRGYMSWVQGLYMGAKHPPAVHVLAGVLVAVAGPNPDLVVFAVNLLFSALLLFSVHGLAGRLGGDWAGPAAAWITAAFPVLVVEAHVLMLDLPLAAAVSCCALAAYCSRGFADRKGAVLTGMALGAGWLVKETFPIFALGIVAGVLVGAWQHREEKGFKAWIAGPTGRNLGLALLAAFMVCGFWYLPNVAKMPWILLKHQAMGGVEKDPSFMELPGLLYYVFAYVNQQASFLIGLSLLFPAGVFLVRHTEKRDLWPLLLWIGIPLLFFTALSNKDGRYTLSVLPAFAILAGAGFGRFRTRWLAVTGATLILVFGAAQALHVGFGVFGRWGQVPLFEAGTHRKPMSIYLFRQDPSMRSRPRLLQPGSVGFHRVVSFLAQEARAAGKKRLDVRHLFDLPEVTAPTEQALCWSNQDARFLTNRMEIRVRSGFFNARDQIDGADVVLVKRKGVQGAAFKDAIREAHATFEKMAPAFRKVGAFPGPDGLPIEVYQKRGTP